MNNELKAYDMFGYEIEIGKIYTCSVSGDNYIITKIKGIML